MLKKKKTSSSNNLLLLLSIFLFFSCSNNPKPEQKQLLKSGMWFMEMDLNGETLPFSFSLNPKNDSWEMVLFNDREEIVVNNVIVRNDSLIAELPVFESEFKLKIKDSENMVGDWHNYYKGPRYKISSIAKYGNRSRFEAQRTQTAAKLNSKYEVTFSEKSENPNKAIGLFNQTDNKLTGTFVTETGDYRHLAGNIYGDSLFLSTFDGSHAFLFKAEIKENRITGMFWSGTHWEETWTAIANDSFQLTNPDSLTFIKPEYEGFDFSFENSSGKLVSLSDSIYKNKVVIVQIMGTWCPNCLDETNYFTELYNNFNPEGLEIVAIAFERTRTREKALNNIKRLKSKTGARYEILLGGSTNKEKAAEALPMLNHVMSYPTAIFINKKGEVKKIHTGFYGPGTKELYVNYKKKTETFIKELLAE